jgi:hypothetical protein
MAARRCIHYLKLCSSIVLLSSSLTMMEEPCSALLEEQQVDGDDDEDDDSLLDRWEAGPVVLSSPEQQVDGDDAESDSESHEYTGPQAIVIQRGIRSVVVGGWAGVFDCCLMVSMVFLMFSGWFSVFWMFMLVLDICDGCKMLFDSF